MLTYFLKCGTIYSVTVNKFKFPVGGKNHEENQ